MTASATILTGWSVQLQDEEGVTVSLQCGFLRGSREKGGDKGELGLGFF